MVAELKTNNMAYKQSPFPMIEGTSPVKQLGLIKHAVRYGIKGAKYIKKVFSKSPFGPPKGKQILPKSKSASFKGTIKDGNYPLGKGVLTRPGKMGSVNHPNFISNTAKQLEESQKYWYNPLKK